MQNVHFIWQSINKTKYLHKKLNRSRNETKRKIYLKKIKMVSVVKCPIRWPNCTTSFSRTDCRDSRAATHRRTSVRRRLWGACRRVWAWGNAEWACRPSVLETTSEHWIEDWTTSTSTDDGVGRRPWPSSSTSWEGRPNERRTSRRHRDRERTHHKRNRPSSSSRLLTTDTSYRRVRTVTRPKWRSDDLRTTKNLRWSTGEHRRRWSLSSMSMMMTAATASSSSSSTIDDASSEFPARFHDEVRRKSSPTVPSLSVKSSWSSSQVMLPYGFGLRLRLEERVCIRSIGRRGRWAGPLATTTPLVRIKPDFFCATHTPLIKLLETCQCLSILLTSHTHTQYKA